MQTSMQNVVREYCQHLFLSFLYQRPGSERLLFKGGTALRIVLHSPRFSEDLDFTGINITQQEVEELFTDTLADIENTGISIELLEGKNTSGGYLGTAVFNAYEQKSSIRIEVSLRRSRALKGVRTSIDGDYIGAYSLVHMSVEEIIRGKMKALIARHKPRDFYDYFFLLSGRHPVVKEKKNLDAVLALLQTTTIDFRGELKEFLPHSHAMHLKGFKKILEQKIRSLNTV